MVFRYCTIVRIITYVVDVVVVVVVVVVVFVVVIGDATAVDSA